MNKFHNDIKRWMINKYTPKDSRVLDLASGRGGDLIKWMRNRNVRSVRGYDISRENVKEANRRLEKLETKKSVKYIVKDLSKYSLKKLKYDVINIQFAIHYFFENKESLETLLETIHNSSKEGTVFMATFLDPEFTEELNLRNISIEFKDIKKNRVFGNEIDVWIKDSILSEPTTEYIVDTAYLMSELSKRGFELVEYLNFKELYEAKHGLTADEKKYSFMNSLVVFKSTHSRGSR